MAALWCVGSWWLLACGGGQAPPPAAANRPPEPEEPVSLPPVAPEVLVRGLTGSMSRYDVKDTMDRRQDALRACVGRRWGVRGLHGAIRFHFRISADGEVVEVYPTGSTVGHRPLELCLTQVVAETRFPPPKGSAETEFEWHMLVDPPEPTRAMPEQWEATEVEKTLRKEGRKSLDSCEARNRRWRYQVTAYVNRRGKVLSASAVPSDPHAADKVDCLVEAVKRWQMPRPKQSAKVTFVLR